MVVPIKARWCLVGEATDDVLLGLLFHSLLPHAVALWVDQGSDRASAPTHAAPMQAAAAAAAVEGEAAAPARQTAAFDALVLASDEFCDSAEQYRRTSGTRRRLFQEYLLARNTRHHLMTLSLTLSPIRALSAWLLKHQPVKNVVASGTPPLIQLVSPHGPVKAALQAYAALIVGGAETALRNADCVDDLEGPHVCMRAILTAASEVFFRFDAQVLQRWQWGPAASRWRRVA